MADNDLLVGPYRGTPRQKKAADLGLEAMARMNQLDKRDIKSSPESWREWFMVEDQTIGYGTVADMVNQGKTKKEINQVISSAKDEVDRNWDLAYDPGYFQLNEYYGGDEFIDACIESRNSRTRNN